MKDELHVVILSALVTLLLGCQPRATDATPVSQSREQQTITSGDRMLADAAEAVRAKLSPCWNIDPNGPMDRVLLHVTMRSDGTVLEAAVSDGDRYFTDESYRKTADRALRAVMNPQCQPLPFPSELWPDWQNVRLVFDPRYFFHENRRPMN